MSRASYITGDVRDVLATIPDGSVDLVMTSPPFLALRSYLPADHPDKHREIGAEPDPAGFLSTLLGLTAEFRRVLAPHGSICVELGDTYSGSGGAGGDYNADGLRAGQQAFSGSAAKRRAGGVGDEYRPARIGRAPAAWPMAKSLCGIPHLYHLSLAYGRNLLTGEPCEPWRVRNVVAWCRPNPPVGALGDKFRPATSYMTIACFDSPKWPRYFDLDAVRIPAAEGKRTDWTYADSDVARATSPGQPPRKRGGTLSDNPGGAPPLDYWEIPTAQYPGSHYAVYPPALCERPVKAMVPRRVCRTCGQPSRRIVDAQRCLDGEPVEGLPAMGDDKARRVQEGEPGNWRYSTTRTDKGWTDCGHDDWRSGILLDPFAGSGTTLAVATGHGHDAIGIDLDERNVALATDRVGPMFLDAYTLDEWKALDR